MEKKYNITQRISKQARKEINRIIETHDKYKNSYFFHSASTAYCRRKNEERFANENPDVLLIRGDEKIHISMEYSETCKNVYYKLSVIASKNGKGEVKNIRYIKDIIK